MNPLLQLATLVTVTDTAGSLAKLLPAPWMLNVSMRTGGGQHQLTHIDVNGARVGKVRRRNTGAEAAGLLNRHRTHHVTGAVRID